MNHVHHTAWLATDGTAARSLSDARLQLHHAAQLGTALGISYLPKAVDDSHTNLGWNRARGTLESRAASGLRGAVSVGVRAADLTLLVLRDHAEFAPIPLHGLTIEAAGAALRGTLASAGLDPAPWTLNRHYELPPHAVASGAPFDASNRPALEQLSWWFGNASLELERLARTQTDASEVRVWPHHLDIATLIALGGGRTTGAGLAPGDQYYDEPYFYVNAYPPPRAEQLTDTLAGGGTWHTHEWIGAVLPGSHLTGDAARQRAQVREFLESAVSACRRLASG